MAINGVEYGIGGGLSLSKGYKGKEKKMQIQPKAANKMTISFSIMISC